MIGQLATTAMGFVDAVMAGRVSPRDLAAVALGNSIWIPVYLLMAGTLLATTPKVAQRFGAGHHTEIGPLVRQSLWLAVVVGAKTLFKPFYVLFDVTANRTKRERKTILLHDEHSNQMLSTRQ